MQDAVCWRGWPTTRDAGAGGHEFTCRDEEGRTLLVEEGSVKLANPTATRAAVLLSARFFAQLDLDCSKQDADCTSGSEEFPLVVSEIQPESSKTERSGLERCNKKQSGVRVSCPSLKHA